MKNVCIVLMLLLSFSIKAQIIKLVGGGGSGGNGSPATAASVYDPNGIALDKYGNIYFAENLGNAVRKIDTAGIISTIAGNGTAGFSGDHGLATAAFVDQPTDVAIDTVGNIYFSDFANNRIRKITVSTGIIATVVGNGTGAYAGDNGPASSASIFLPSSVCFDKAGNMYIADDGNFRVRKVNTVGVITTVAGTGVNGFTGNGGPATAAECAPTCVRVNATGNIYIAEDASWRVRKINTAGIISTVAGDSISYIYNGDGIPATSANIDPQFIGLDKDDLLYISDYHNNRIRKVDSMGIIHTVVGNGISGYSGDGGQSDSAEIYWASGLVFDACNNLYFCQVNYPRIRKVAFHPPCMYANLKVPETTSNEVVIYPNPFTTDLNVNGLRTSAKYVILNITGIIEQQGTLKEGNNTIPVGSLPPGVYLIRINGTVMRKFVKE